MARSRFNTARLFGSGVITSFPLQITGTLPGGTVGQAYSFTPGTSGGSGTKTFALTGTLPGGLSFSTSTGAITGTPTTAGTTSGLTITVTDTSGTAKLTNRDIVVSKAVVASTVPIRSIVSMAKETYDALTVKDPSTLYKTPFGDFLGDVLSGASSSSATTFAAALPTEAAILAARSAAIAAGGGTVLIPAGTITLTAPITLVGGVSYVGVKPLLTFTSTIPDSVWSFSGGTVLMGDGTFDCFAANTVDLGSPAATFDASIENVLIKDIGFDTFKSAINVGAVNAMGFMYSELTGLFIQNCSDWALKCQNFMHTRFHRMWARENAHGLYFACAMPSTTLSSGNSTVDSLFVIPSSAKGRLSRGVVFEGRGGILNEIATSRLQINRFVGSELSQSVTLTSGSTSIPVADGTQFSVGMPVIFTTTALGVTAEAIYIVRSVVGNTITVAQSYSGTVVTASGNGSLTMKTLGFPNLEVIGTGIGAVANCHFYGLDIEGRGSCSLYVEKANNVKIQVSEINTTEPYVHICLRASPTNMIHNTNPSLITDFDSASASAVFFGARGKIIQNSGSGQWLDSTKGTTGTLSLKSVTGNAPDLDMRGNGFLLYPNVPIGRRAASDNTAVRTLNIFGGCLTYRGGSNATWTLPTIVNANTQTSTLGVEVVVVNASAFTLTINTDGTQLFQQLAGKTTMTLASGQSVILSSQDSGTLYWAVLGGYGVTF